MTKAGPAAVFPSKLTAAAQLAKLTGWNEVVRISTIASQRSGTILILLPPWIVPMLNVGARSRVSGKLPPL